MKRVILESPYKADTADGVAANIAYAKACARDCLSRGESPFAGHLLFAQDGILDDTIPSQRDLGIAAGLAWQNVAEAVVVYTDRGISGGMALSIDRAKFYKIPIEYRSLKANETAA